MELRDVEYVMAIARHENLTKAAEELYITQPSLSKFISNFEGRLGVRLFDRVGKKFVLNDAGECFIKEGRRMLVIRENLEHQLADFAAHKKARLTVGMYQTRAIALMPRILPVFNSKYHWVDLSLVEQNSKTLEEMLCAGKVDVAIVNLPIEHAELDYEILRQDEAVLCVSKDSPMNELGHEKDGFNYPWLDLSQLSDDTRFIVADNDPRLVKQFTGLLELNGIKLSQLIYTHNLLTAITFAATGVGLCYSFYDSIRLSQYKDAFKVYSIGDTPVCKNIAVAYRKSIAVPEYISGFIQILKEQYKN